MNEWTCPHCNEILRGLNTPPIECPGCKKELTVEPGTVLDLPIWECMRCKTKFQYLLGIKPQLCPGTCGSASGRTDFREIVPGREEEGDDDYEKDARQGAWSRTGRRR